MFNLKSIIPIFVGHKVWENALDSKNFKVGEFTIAKINKLNLFTEIYKIWLKRLTIIICVYNALFFQILSTQKLGMYIIHENYFINFFPRQHTLPYSEWDDQKCVISVVQINVFSIITEKYPLECIFVYNFVPPCELIFEASFLHFVWTCLYVFSKYCINFMF